ncbi:CNH domain-containing protein [Kalaharituber pfeilii]|nr:CNH domain-containing protein [Kalaharituber pfeilii]
MANHHPNQQRAYRPGYNPPPPSTSQREAAFSDIFGAAPPPGRSYTMTSQPPQMLYDSGRSHTMTSQMSDLSTSSQQPLLRPNGYNNHPPSNGYNQAHHYPPQQSPQQQQFPPRIQSHAQYLPQPIAPDRRPYPQPVRVETGAPSQPGYQRPPPHRYYPPAPALNADPYRSRSMANMPSYPIGPPPSHGPGPYPPGPGPSNMTSRTTAQGRVVPERHDERSMSLTSYPHDRDHMQTMSGRVIPHRRKESQDSQFRVESQQRHNTMGANSHYTPPTKARSPSSVSTASSLTIPPVSSKEVLGQQNRPPYPGTTPSSHNSTIVTSSRRPPLVYPALLSRVADVFRDRIAIGDRVKNELTYKSAFTGAEAVDIIAYIIKTSDRNLALLLGRALDAQRLFHDVTYEHRLRDSQSEVYQFRSLVDEDRSEVNGVFTLLTECYSPTCTRDNLCYSIACPRRLEQQARLNMKPQPGLKRQESKSSLHGDDEKDQKLWIHSVPKEIAESVSDKEKKRQEVICEVIYTERDFVKDLEYLRDFWIKPLRSNNPQNPSPIPEHRREIFIRMVFSNVLEVHSVNARLAEALTKRQQQSAIVNNIGDIFLEYVPMFEPFIKYGASQLYGKYEFEKEKAANPAFAKCVEETERMKESRKLELNGYLTKPTTRLARYPLLLEAVLKATTDDNPDKKDLPKAIELIREFLTKVNIESGKSENQFNLMQLNQQLIFPAEHIDLKLTEEGRQLIYKGTLKKSAAESSTDIQTFLFDHALLLVRIKVVNKREVYKVYRKPIPLELLVITQLEEVVPRQGGGARRTSSSLIPGTKNAAAPRAEPPAPPGRGFPITFQHLGRRGYVIQLYASSQIQRKKWIQHIEAQQKILRERSNIYTRTILCENFFGAGNRVNCLVPLDGGTKLLYGTDNGIYVSDRRAKDGQKKEPVKVLDVQKVEQLDVLEEYSMLLILADKTVSAFPVEGLLENDGTPIVNKKPKKIVGHTNFFKAGVCLGRVLVCCVKTSTQSIVRVLEPLESMAKGRKRPALREFLRGGHESLKPYKEFYVPAEATSIHFLKSTLCVGCAKGFEVVSLETLETQSLLDPADTSLDFVERREGNIKPIAIYRHEGEFLLNYSDFSFFVNRNGWGSRTDWRIAWEGQPTAFALSHGYILAFEPSFIEIRDVKTAALVHIVTGKNIRMLHESTREIIYAYEDESGSGDDVIASLEFLWSRPPRTKEV